MRQGGILVVFVSVILSIVWWNCAGQVSPDGGPEDLTPPNIIGVYPEPNSTNVDTDIIRFEFSKHVDRGSFDQALFISPIIDDIETNWRGRRVELTLNEPLRENTTYSITIGTDLRDTREGTRMSEAFTLAFSTGDEIDQGQIAGTIYHDDPVGALIFAYELKDSVMADTLNPAEQSPDYITQTGDGGRYRLPYLRMGMYRIIAVHDEFQNRLYDRDADPYGVYIRDLTLTEDEPNQDEVNIRMHKPDFTRPFLSRITAIHHSKIVLRFSKAIDPASLHATSFQIIHNETEESLAVNNYSIRKSNPSEIYLFTAQQEDGEYSLTIDSTLTDLYGNTIRSDELTEVFDGNPADPEEPVVVEYSKPADGERNIQPTADITLQFSYPVRTERSERAIWVVDTNEVALTGDFFWENETIVTFKPSRLLESKMPYTVVVELDSLPAKYGLQYEDSLYTSTFTSLDRDLLGTIEGEVFSDQNDPLTINVNRVGRTGNGGRYQVTRIGGGSFTVRHVPEGEYTLWTFRDIDESGEYNYGSVFPYQGSAPFVTYADTVRVRARWTVDGIILDMRRYDDVEQLDIEAAGLPDE